MQTSLSSGMVEGFGVVRPGRFLFSRATNEIEKLPYESEISFVGSSKVKTDFRVRLFCLYLRECAGTLEK